MTEASVARQTLSKARTLLRLTERLDLNEHEEFAVLLESAIVFGRSVTFHLQKEYSSKSGFEEWYKDQQAQLNNISLCRFFLNMRNFILKEGPAKTTRNISVAIYATATIKTSLDAILVSGQPWYRRNPIVLWGDIRVAIRNRWQRYRRVRAMRQMPPTERKETTKITQTWYFDDANRQDRSAPDLVRDYLDTLEAVVIETERKFGSTGL